MITQYILLAIIFCQAVQSRRLLASEASKCDQCAAYGFKLGIPTKKACWNCDCGDGKRICGCIHCKNEPKPLLKATPSPTTTPTKEQTPTPTNLPTPSPSNFPTSSPTEVPSPSPTDVPSPSPTDVPSPSPTNVPSPSPTSSPTEVRPAFRVTPGADCEDGYEPLTSSWENCKAAAVTLGFKGDSINFVEYNYPWGSKRPQGCFQSNGNNRIHFNRGPGGNFEGTDKIICKLVEQRQNQIYTRTQGYCRGGVKYPGLPTLWKCIRDPTITNAQCQQHCDNDENCNAYDRRESEKSECCLFSTGHTGNGGNGRVCYVNLGRSTTSKTSERSAAIPFNFVFEFLLMLLVLI